MHSTPCLGSTLTLLALTRADDMDGGLAPKSNLAVGMRKAQEAERARREGRERTMDAPCAQPFQPWLSHPTVAVTADPTAVT
jgi:hypothetical protein